MPPAIIAGPARSSIIPRGPNSRKNIPAKVTITPQTARAGHMDCNLILNNIGFTEKLKGEGPFRPHFTGLALCPDLGRPSGFCRPRPQFGLWSLDGDLCSRYRRHRHLWCCCCYGSNLMDFCDWSQRADWRLDREYWRIIELVCYWRFFDTCFVGNGNCRWFCYWV